MGTHGAQGFEAGCLVVLEGAEFVYDDHVKRPLTTEGFHQPGDVLPVDDGHHRPRGQGVEALLSCTDSDRNGQPIQVIPLEYFCRPGIPRHSQRRNHKNPAGFEGVQQEAPDGGQGNDRLAEPHAEQDRGLGVLLNKPRGLSLVVMRLIAHGAPPQSGSWSR